ncbi:hypothetical protein MES5069_510005 [Mesorhizobium escarrei]|uniref:Uncharacterized protein n=1 Tax=Mesorhizobium escarrei TaxID=666018 RepID=A0ABM9EA16_9HYPH|nr:hypothetical protein MES5069_510005 [Mesorhizobium escarrei]
MYLSQVYYSEMYLLYLSRYSFRQIRKRQPLGVYYETINNNSGDVRFGRNAGDRLGDDLHGARRRE